MPKVKSLLGSRFPLPPMRLLNNKVNPFLFHVKLRPLAPGIGTDQATLLGWHRASYEKVLPLKLRMRQEAIPQPAEKTTSPAKAGEENGSKLWRSDNSERARRIRLLLECLTVSSNIKGSSGITYRLMVPIRLLFPRRGLTLKLNLLRNTTGYRGRTRLMSILKTQGSLGLRHTVRRKYGLPPRTVCRKSRLTTTTQPLR